MYQADKNDYLLMVLVDTNVNAFISEKIIIITFYSILSHTVICFNAFPTRYYAFIEM